MHKRTYWIFLIVLVVATSGCVKRGIVVASTPPGAQVWINEHMVGTTPLEYDFITHGQYKFRLEKEGYEEVVSRELVKAPVYQWIGVDFIAEYMYPGQLEDVHEFHYQLEPTAETEVMPLDSAERNQKVVAWFDDADPAKRRRACIEASKTRNEAWIPKVQASLNDPHPEVRIMAVFAWRVLQGEAALPELLRVLAEDADDQVRWQTTAELEVLKSPEAVPGLIEALSDRTGLVRSGAAQALNAIGDKRAVGPLTRLLRDRDSTARRTAAEALGKMGDDETVGALTRTLRHRDFQTRRRAARSLVQLNATDAGVAFVRLLNDWDPEVRDIATEGLIAFNAPDTYPRLIRTLRSRKHWARAQAATIIEALEIRDAQEALEVAVERESVPETRTAIKKALSAIKQVNHS